MEVNITEIGEVVVAAPVGEIDGQTAPLFEEALLPLAQPAARVLLDMSGVSYLSSAGLRLLLVLYRQISRQDGRVVLSGLSSAIADTMFNTGFLDFFDAYATPEEALAALNRP